LQGLKKLTEINEFAEMKGLGILGLLRVDQGSGNNNRMKHRSLNATLKKLT
jgi:hypothetical protein